jgi:hypothetical protein
LKLLQTNLSVSYRMIQSERQEPCQGAFAQPSNRKDVWASRQTLTTTARTIQIHLPHSLFKLFCTELLT